MDVRRVVSGGGLVLDSPHQTLMISRMHARLSFAHHHLDKESGSGEALRTNFQIEFLKRQRGREREPSQERAVSDGGLRSSGQGSARQARRRHARARIARHFGGQRPWKPSAPTGRASMQKSKPRFAAAQRARLAGPREPTGLCYGVIGPAQQRRPDPDAFCCVRRATKPLGRQLRWLGARQRARARYEACASPRSARADFAVLVHNSVVAAAPAAPSDAPTRLQEEGYPPPAEMPIKQLQFTPLKAPPAPAAIVSNASAKLSDASSKDSVESAEDAEGGASSDGEVRGPHLLSLKADAHELRTSVNQCSHAPASAFACPHRLAQSVLFSQTKLRWSECVSAGTGRHRGCSNEHQHGCSRPSRAAGLRGKHDPNSDGRKLCRSVCAASGCWPA